jgi:hypothetical protein
MFDQSKKVTHSGIVEEVQWTNPHVWIFVSVAKEDGTTERRGMEFTSKEHLTRRNFNPDLVKPGDQVEFTVSPYGNGKPGGRFYTIKLANGSYYCDVGAAQQVCEANNCFTTHFTHCNTRTGFSGDLCVIQPSSTSCTDTGLCQCVQPAFPLCVCPSFRCSFLQYGRSHQP